MPRKILILTNRVPFPLKDGGALAMNAMIKGYTENSWQVFLLAMNTMRHTVKQNELAVLYKNLTGFETVDVDNRIHVFSVLKNLFFSKAPEHADRFYTNNFRDKLKQVLLSFEPDVVQMESIYLNTYFDIIKDNADAFIVQRLHNIEYQIWQRLAEESNNLLKKNYLRILSKRIKRFEQQAWDDADLLLPITQSDATIIANTGCNTKVHVTPFGIDIKSETKNKSHTEQWNGYHIGAMNWMPNEEAMDWFIHDVWKHIHHSVPEFKFYFAGRDMPEKFKKNLPEGVFCKGEVPDAKTFSAEKKILIVPLRSGSGIRIKILEAMAAEKLVISTPIGMQGIDAISGIHYLQANTPEEFAMRIKHILSNKNEALQIVANAWQFVYKNYNQQQIAAGLSDSLKKSLNTEQNNV